SDVLPDDVRVWSNGDRMYLSINGTTDVLRVEHEFYQDNTDNPYKIDEVHFANGTVWNVAMLRAKVLEGTEGSENIYGFSDTSDVLNGYGGNDNLYGRQGNDT